jgi:hypothetical protein
MARKTDKQAPLRSATTDGASEADPPATEAQATASDPAADGESTEDAAPMNRAERRLEAKRQKGRNPSTRTQPQGRSAPGQGLRGRGFQGGTGQTKGTNTRRSG